MSDLVDAVASVRNLVCRPGMFDTLYPETTDVLLLSVLMDALAEAHLEGLLLANNSDTVGVVTPDLTSGQSALVVLFAGVRFLRAELLNRNTSVTYKAGSASYETTQATNILRDILKSLQAQKDRLVALSSTTGANSAFYMADQYLARIWEHTPVACGW